MARLAWSALCAVLCLAVPVTARAEEEWKPRLLLGGGVGVTGITGYGFEAHVGLGARSDRLFVFGVADHAYTSGQAFLGAWSLDRRHVALSALVVFLPIEGHDVHLHATLGGGSAWDTFTNAGESSTTQRWTAVGSAGVGWKALTLLARAAVPGPRASPDSRTTYTADSGVLFLATASIVIGL